MEIVKNQSNIKQPVHGQAAFPKEKTLEETITEVQKSIDVAKERNLSNIQKIEARAAAATGEEKTRLQGLLALHQSHRVELDARDATEEGTERFNAMATRLNK